MSKIELISLDTYSRQRTSFANFVVFKKRMTSTIPYQGVQKQLKIKYKFRKMYIWPWRVCQEKYKWHFANLLKFNAQKFDIASLLIEKRIRASRTFHSHLKLISHFILLTQPHSFNIATIFTLTILQKQLF